MVWGHRNSAICGEAESILLNKFENSNTDGVVGRFLTDAFSLKKLPPLLSYGRFNNFNNKYFPSKEIYKIEIFG